MILDHKLQYYILDGDETKPVSLKEYLKWFYKTERLLAKDEVDDALVSTVFLGVDHRFQLDGPPVLFETMIFGGPHDAYSERYSTKAEALEGHQKALRIVRG